VNQREKDRDTSEAELDLLSGFNFTMAGLGTDSEGKRITPRRYPMGPLLDWSRGEEFWDLNQAAFAGDPNEAAEAAHTEDYVAKERIAALYGWPLSTSGTSSSSPAPGMSTPPWITKESA
jgi:hypothetical protein